MRFRPQAGTLLASLLWALPGVIALPRVALAQPAPATALITAVRGNTLTLAVGTEDGAKIGQTYRLTRGSASAKIQITAVTASESTATLIQTTPGYDITVGDTASFLGEEPLAPAVTVVPAPGGPLQLPPAPPSTAVATNNGQAPNRALITSVNGNNVTLGIGSADGAKLGAVYAVPLDGDVKARLQITGIDANESQATLRILEEGFTPTVGENARFVGIEALPAPTPKPAPPVSIPTPANPSTIVPPTTLPVSPVQANGVTVAAAPVSTVMGSTATVTSIDRQNVVISAGSAQGAKTGLNVPIIRAGAIIGLLRLQTVSDNSSSGVVLWRDESLGAIAAGDAVGILGAAPTVGVPAIGTVSNNAPTATLVKYETGASNLSVPRAGGTYELLAALAASGLIQSQPASVFQDDGVRRHNPSEDMIFTGGQIAGFIREAISNYGTQGSGRDRAALSILTKSFHRDLIKLGETETTLAPFTTDPGVSVGVSGLTRLTLAGGDNEAASRDPFSERYGQRRSKTGYDTRTNVFGQLTPRLNFYGSVDYGNDRRNGPDNVNNLQVRNAYLTYNAGNILRGLTVNIGRKEFWWGPGQFGTSVLSDTSGGLNSFNTIFERGSYRVEGMYAYLGRGPVGGMRSLYGQNFSVKLGNSVRVGSITTILSPKDKFDPKLFFGAMTPISLYVLDRQGSLQDKTNAVVNGYVEAGVARGARVYGEIALDDLSVSGKNLIEDRQGAIVGANFFNPLNPTKAGAKVEYARFNSLSYLAFLGPNRDPDYYYFNRGAPLGYPITPVAPTSFGGANSLRFEGYVMPTKRLHLNGGLEFSDINSEDQNPAPSGGRGFTRQRVYRFSAAYDLSQNFTLTARAQRIETDQPNFIKNEPGIKEKFFSLEIGRSF